MVTVRLFKRLAVLLLKFSFYFIVIALVFAVFYLFLNIVELPLHQILHTQNVFPKVLHFDLDLVLYFSHERESLFLNLHS